VAYKFFSKWTILGILFGVPVLFILIFDDEVSTQVSVKHNYNPLDIVSQNIVELDSLKFLDNKKANLEDNITILSFVGNKPMSKVTGSLNLKQLVYDKFKGFKFNKKKFQIITISLKGSEDETELLRRELLKYDKLEYWYFANSSIDNYKIIYRSLLDRDSLDSFYASDNVFIIDESRNQRGRIVDEYNEEANIENIGLYSYNTISISEIKNKMNDDIRILFTEYRDRRKGEFNRQINKLKN
tara:strand:- start:2599 stop:3324 length:726 start_codon:yes stop_codon:yes gene_type:complete